MFVLYLCWQASDTVALSRFHLEAQAQTQSDGREAQICSSTYFVQPTVPRLAEDQNRGGDPPLIMAHARSFETRGVGAQSWELAIGSGCFGDAAFLRFRSFIQSMA
jgi:hypothetical protein